MSLTATIYKCFVVAFWVGWLFKGFFMVNFLDIPTRALCLDSCSESKFNNMSFCSNMETTSKQRVGK